MPGEPSAAPGRPHAGKSAGPAEPSGDALVAAVRIMDRLRSPGGCPWDAAQTHASLRHYLLEETYEVLEAIDADDPAGLREELGDLLLQVLFHARIAQERGDDQRFDIDDVAADLATKLTRRHPHVFGDTVVSGAGQVEANWEQIKQSEKGRTSVVDGVVTAQPALARAAKLINRARRAGLDVAPPAPQTIGGRLFALVAEAAGAGVDAEMALREALSEFTAAVRHREAAEDCPAAPVPADPAAERSDPAGRSEGTVLGG